MNLTARFARFFFPTVLSLTLCSLAWISTSVTNGAEVTGLLGAAQYSRQGQPFAPVKVGQTLQAGDLLQTARGAALDLSLGDRWGTIRLTQSSTLALQSVPNSGSAPAATNTPVQVQLDLRTGEMLGQIKKLPPDARFQVKTPAGIAGVLEGRFRLDTRGLVVLLEGSALFAEIRGTADPVVHTLKSSTPLYLVPGETPRSAPAPLEKEVQAQFKARLPRR